MNKYILLPKYMLYIIASYLLFHCLCTQAFEYQKSTLPNENETLTGISREEALRKFGTPVMINKNIWYYEYPRHFYIKFSKTPHISKFFIIPYYYNINKGFPFEMKAFITYDNFKTTDITPYVQWSIADKNIVRRNKNVFLPLKEGKTEIFALYKGLISSPSHIYVKPANKKNAREKLLSINIFPHNPNVHQNSSITFLAFGTFINTKKKIIFVKDISSKVKWFISRKGKIIDNGGQTVYLYNKGIIYVFCEYDSIKSTIQKVSIRDDTYEIQNTLKNVYLIPQILTADEGMIVTMKAIATYFNSRVEDVTNNLFWKIDNIDSAALIDKGRLKLKKEGIVKVEGTLFNKESFSSKIIIKRKVKPAERGNIIEEEKEENTKKEAINDILNNTENIIYKLSTQKGNIKSLRIAPIFKTISVGEETKLRATAVYNDGVKTDVTALAKWQSSDSDKVSIEKGKVRALLSGETDIKAYIGKIKSNVSHIVIKPPALTSISLNYEKVRLGWKKSISIKATGHYTDKSTKDITALAKWHIGNDKILKILNKGTFQGEKPGNTEIYCEYNGVKSLPVKISVFIPLSVILKIALLCVFILLVAVFTALYIATKSKIIKLKNMCKDNPRGMIKELYNNIRKVLNIFGLSHKDTIPPYAYAKIINNTFSIKDDTFLKLARKFSEAEYSSHTITQNDALYFINEYNKGIKEIKKNNTKFFMRYMLLLLYRLPFTI